MSSSVRPCQMYAFVLPAWLRLIAASSVLCTALGLFLILLAVVASHDPPITPPVLFQMSAGLAVLPFLLSRWILHSSKATVAVDDHVLTLSLKNRRIEVPLAAIATIEPWTIPLPEPGIDLRLQSGARLAWGISGRDVAGVVAVLIAHGIAPASGPAVQFSRARAAVAKASWPYLLGKFPILALAPSLILFRAHQYIAYGGWWGQWNLYGPQAWFETLAIYWAATTIYTLLYAGVLRVAMEVVAWLLTQLLPTSARTIRERGETVLRLAYYVGVPAMLALRFAPW